MILKSKTWIRSNDQLEDRRINFLEICKVLDSLNITFFLQGGSLLAARRDKKFIEWDWDVEISLFSEDFLNNFEIIIIKLLEKDFKLQTCLKDKFLGKIELYKNYDHEVTGYTIFGWAHDTKKEIYWRNRIKFPDKFLKKFDKIDFYGKEFNAPNPIDEYLKYQYGNWRVRKKTDVKEDYMSSNFYKKDNHLIKLGKKLLKYTRNL